MIVGIDHGYYAIKTKHVSFPSGIIKYDYEPYTMQNVLQYRGKYYVCGTGRQTLVKNKTSNDNYYLLTLAAIAEEIKHRKAERKTEVILAVGLPLSSFGREKQGFREYLLRKEQPVRFLYESEWYEIQIKDVKLFPQGYSALALHPEYLKNEPSVLLVDIGGWTVDLMRLDNAVPNAATCRSLELGVIRCIDETAEQVRRNTGLSVTETQIERVLRGETCSMAEDARVVIQENGRKYIERILSAVTESGFDLRAVPSVFMGGGSAILKRHVTAQDAICRPVFIEDVHANAAGYERIVEQIPFKPEYYLKKTYPEHHDRTVEEKVYMEILHKLYAFPLVPRLIFLHLWCTGLRISEVCTLKGDAYYWDGEDAWLKVYQIKMKADKMIPIPLVMYRIMRKYIEREHIRPKDYIFKGKDGGAYRGTTFRQEFQQYCDKNGIADGSYIFKTHDYRHTLATQFYDEDVSIQTIRDYLGHFSEEMTKQYVDFMPKRIEKASDTYFKKPENDLASTIKAKKRGERK